jgi:hypothetical protein
VCGLAKRYGEVAFEPLLEYLRSGFAATGCIDAAGAWGDLRFVDALAAIREAQPRVANSAAVALRLSAKPTSERGGLIRLRPPPCPPSVRSRGLLHVTQPQMSAR